MKRKITIITVAIMSLIAGQANAMMEISYTHILNTCAPIIRKIKEHPYIALASGLVAGALLIKKLMPTQTVATETKCADPVIDQKSIEVSTGFAPIKYTKRKKGFASRFKTQQQFAAEQDKEQKPSVTPEDPNNIRSRTGSQQAQLVAQLLAREALKTQLKSVNK